MKKLLFLICVLLTVAFATSKDNFVLNILKDDNPVREIDGIAVVPFDSEYEILIKNDNNRRCTAKVTIDGTDISSLGDFIISANGALNLERFVTESLTECKRFKFVPLDNPAVDDPTRKENGIVRVELKLEKKYIYPRIIYPVEYPNCDSMLYWDWETSSNIPCDGVNGLDFIWDNCKITLCSASMPGATIAGSESNQRFYEADFNAEDKTVVLELKLMGIE